MAASTRGEWGEEGKRGDVCDTGDADDDMRGGAGVAECFLGLDFRAVCA